MCVRQTLMAEKKRTQIQRNQIRGRRLKQRSEVWEHFTRDTGDDGKERAKCKRCPKVYAYHGTKNLWEHYNEGCGRQESADAGTSEQPPQPLPSLAQDEALQQQLPLLSPIPLPLPACAPSRYGGSSDGESSGLQEEASKHLARMIALRGYDASVLEDDCFRCFVRSLNPEFEVPSRVAIENMCDGISDEARRELLDWLRRAPGKVSVAVGRAKTMDEQIFWVACHFIDDGWNLHKLLLHAIVTTDHRTYCDGPILGLDVDAWPGDIDDRVCQVIANHGIGNRLLLVACETTDEYIGLVVSDESSLWPHLTNPNRKEILFATYVDNVLHSIAECLLHDSHLTEAMFDDMANLRLTRQERLKLYAELGLHYGRAYDKSWYACYCSLKVLCKKGFPGQLRALKFIAISKLLCEVWEEIICAIQKISSSTCPTANLCLVELFNLREVLHPGLEWYKNGDHEDVHHELDDIEYVSDALKKANDTLDEAIKDSYLAWSLPLAMDPRYKLQFITSNLKKAYDSEAAEEYVSKVTTMITGLYADYVKQYGTTQGADHSDGASSAMDITTSAVVHCGSQQDKTELDRYLEDPRAPHHLQAEGFDILSWWKAHSSEYPLVARMARDALAMPTCSKLSSNQMAHVRSILRGYSKKPYRFPLEDDTEEEE